MTPLGPARRLAAAATLALALSLAACGEESASDPSSEPSGEPGTPGTSQSPTPSGDDSTGTPEDGEVEHRPLSIDTGTNVGGEVSDEPALLDSEAAVDTWLSQFEDERFRQELRSALASAPGPTGDEAVMGAVLHIGCESPQDYALVREDGRLRVEVAVPKETVQCFAPMTTTAIFAVDASELGPAGVS